MTTKNPTCPQQHTQPSSHITAYVKRVPSPDPADADDRDLDHIALAISAHLLGYNGPGDVPVVELLIDPDGAEVRSTRLSWPGSERPDQEINLRLIPLWGLVIIEKATREAARDLGMLEDWGGSGWWIDEDGEDKEG
jgi:hypothetical protein